MPDIASQPKQLSLSDDEFSLFRNLIYDKAGIHFNESKKYLLENRLALRLRECGLDNFEEYFRFINTATHYGRSEMLNLFEAVTTNETFFFRNPPQLKVFQEEILPRVVKDPEKARSRRLRLWSVGCSSGEEPYTLAIQILEQLGVFKDQWDVNILAHDISHEMLKRAETGLYNEHSMRLTPDPIKQRYFERVDQGYQVKDLVKALVKFEFMNLKDHLRMRLIRSMDIVFCRNVIIYFDEQMKKSVIGHLNQALNDGGYLFIGHSESLHGITDAFKLIHFPGAIVYQKPIPGQ
jgi:chemotaxis protein methyltransferase CheR